VSGATVVVLIAIVALVAWWFDLQRHPIRRCPSCNGTKKNGGSTPLRWGTCRRCSGKGEVRRRGASGS
jgi:DnaJ-class molecular chaperone